MGAKTYYPLKESELVEMYNDLRIKYSVASGDTDKFKTWNHDREVHAIRFIFELAAYVHFNKSLTYRDSWKKRGWIASVFSNISRKFDRLESIFTVVDSFKNILRIMQKTVREELVLDTFIDLGNYSFLSATELLFTKNQMFNKLMISLFPKQMADDEDRLSLEKNTLERNNVRPVERMINSSDLIDLKKDINNINMG